MKRIVSCILCLVIFMCSFGVGANAESTMNLARLNNISSQNSSFSIENDVAIMSAVYTGYEGIFQKASINITLEKRFLWAFWNEVESWSYECYDTIGVIEVLHEVGSGTYRATFEYQIYGVSGEVDSMVDELEMKN